jgi:alcohol dehydrogenase
MELTKEIIMRAVRMKAYGGVETLELVADAQEPDLKDGQILVEAKAASINPIDYVTHEGYLKEMFPLQFPSTIGGDFSGVVKKVGNNVAGLKVGDQVYGLAIVFNGGSGSFADFVAANAANTALKPLKANFLEAAALPLAGVSALQAIEDHMNLKKGQKVLIHGGAGGIGSIAIQIAKSIGAFIATTASEKDRNFVKELGANLMLDYHTQKFQDELKDYDAVLDTLGGEITGKSLMVLRHGGVLVSLRGQPNVNESLAKERNVRAIGMFTETTTENLNRLRDYVDNGTIRVHVDRVFALNEFKNAFEHAEHKHPQGKVVTKIN